MIYVKLGSTLVVMFRAFLASDHVSVATGKTIAITISKNGGAFGNPNAGATNATEISSGWYKVSLDATDTGTAGPLAVRGAVATVDDVGVLFYVGQSPADVTHLLGTAWLTPGTAGTPDVNVKLWNGLTTVALPLVPTTAGRTLDVSATGEAGIDWANIGSPTTVVGLSGTTVKTATDVETDTQDIQTRLPAALTANGNMKADTLRVSGTPQTARDIGAAVPAAAPGGNGGLPLVDANNYVAGIQGTKNQLDDLNDVSTAQVNAEVVDAIATDTYAEPGQEAPGATVSLSTKISYLYKFLRNKKTSDGTTEKLYADDATTVDQKRPVSEAAGTVTKGEVVSGP